MYIHEALLTRAKYSFISRPLQLEFTSAGIRVYRLYIFDSCQSLSLQNKFQIFVLFTNNGSKDDNNRKILYKEGVVVFLANPEEVVANLFFWV